MANLDRRDNKNKGKAESDDTLASLMDQYVASTREPVGSGDLFRETSDPQRGSEINDDWSPTRPEPEPRESGSQQPSLTAIYLIGMMAALVAAVAYVLVAGG